MLFKKYDSQIRLLTEFRHLVERYIEFNQKSQLTDNERKEFVKTRERLNFLNFEINRIVSKVGISPTAWCYIPRSPILQEINVIEHIFDLYEYMLSPDIVIDFIDRAHGQYSFLQKEFRRKIVNPLYWIGEIIRIPFHLIKSAGFDAAKIEFSIIGKSFKLAMYLLSSFMAAYAFLKLFSIDLVEIIKNMF